ncbi:hypothetical protein Ocin01_16184 [Orchesella cincta]|uniref:Uncharacterized protein n=1 Tax=Orchesella cincta TaxID=48709 RepID=A0A1D2MBX4_ORCCI|nr:hypothetical protein Ocin01_16184 [Orchesella cincta]
MVENIPSAISVLCLFVDNHFFSVRCFCISSDVQPVYQLSCSCKLRKMDQNGNNIKYTGGKAPGDPRLRKHQNWGPLNTSMEDIKYNQCQYQQHYKNSSSRLNAGPQYGNINSSLDTDLRNIQQYPQHVPSTSSTLTSPYSSKQSLYDGNLYHSSQMHQIGVPLLQPPMSPTVSIPENSLLAGCHDQIYQCQYGQPRPIGAINYDAYGIQSRLNQPFVDSGDTHISSTFTNVDCDSLDIIPRADSSITGNPNNKVETSNYESLNKTLKPAVPVIMIGKRRGGKILPTGVIKRPKVNCPKQSGKVEKAVDPSKLDVKSPAWNRYLAEVQQYRSQLCSEEKQNHPLVK